MVEASKGMRHGTRRVMKKGLRDKLVISNFIQTFKCNEKVLISINPASQKGMPHPRFIGKIGIVKRVNNGSYSVKVMLGNKEKCINIKPEHMKKSE